LQRGNIKAQVAKVAKTFGRSESNANPAETLREFRYALREFCHHCVFRYNG